MKTSVKSGIIFALLWIIIVLAAYLMGKSVQFFIPSELLNILLLLAAIFSGLFLTKKENNYEKVNAIEDFKIAMQSGIVYTIMITGFVYLYHSQIDLTIKDSLIEERIAALHEVYPNEAAYKELQAVDDKWKEKSFDDFIENEIIQTRTFIGSFYTTFFHLMILFMFSLFYSFFVSLIIRKIILRH